VALAAVEIASRLEDPSVVSKPEWGTKRICQSCGAKFYDFKKSPVACPSCGTQFDPEAFLKSRRAKPVKEKEAPKKPAPAPAAAEDDEDEEIPAEGEEDLVVGDDENDEDNDDLNEVAVDKDKDD
jgi:uncharacterized protein (TIGR02300 family)